MQVDNFAIQKMLNIKDCALIEDLFRYELYRDYFNWMRLEWQSWIKSERPNVAHEEIFNVDENFCEKILFKFLKKYFGNF